MNISYIIRSKKKEVITGGHVYDSLLVKAINKGTIHKVTDLSFYIGNIEKNLLLAPFLYLGKALKEKNTDIYLLNSVIFMRFMLVPFFVRVFKKKKLIAIHHHFMHKELNGIKRTIYGFFEWSFLRQMNKIIVASPYIYDELLNKIPAEKLILFKIPFENKQFFEPKPIKGTLTFTGTIEKRKGLDYLIQALILLKDRGRNYNLTVIGKVIDQKYYEKLIQEIKNHNLNVKFTGYLPKKEKEKILSETDVFVFPSLLEGYGMALIEAQVYGLPIVSFDNSAMPYNVKNDINGYTVPTGNVEDFAYAIEKTIEHRDIRDRFSKGALENLANQNTLNNFEKDIIQEFNLLRI